MAITLVNRATQYDELICNGPIGHRSISSVILTEEDTDISLYPSLQSESGNGQARQAGPTRTQFTGCASGKVQVPFKIPARGR